MSCAFKSKLNPIKTALKMSNSLGNIVALLGGQVWLFGQRGEFSDCFAQ